MEYEGAELHLEKKVEYLERKKAERAPGGKKAEGDDSDGEELQEGAEGAAAGEAAGGAAAAAGKKRGREGAAVAAAGEKDGEAAAAAAGAKKAKTEDGEKGEKQFTFVAGGWGQCGCGAGGVCVCECDVCGGRRRGASPRPPSLLPTAGCLTVEGVVRMRYRYPIVGIP